MTARQALLCAYMFQAMFFFGLLTGLNSAEPGIQKVAVSLGLAAAWPWPCYLRAQLRFAGRGDARVPMMPGPCYGPPGGTLEPRMSTLTIVILVFLALIVLGGFHGPVRTHPYYPVGGGFVGLGVIVVLVLLLTGHL